MRSFQTGEGILDLLREYPQCHSFVMGDVLKKKIVTAIMIPFGYGNFNLDVKMLLLCVSYVLLISDEGFILTI